MESSEIHRKVLNSKKLVTAWKMDLLASAAAKRQENASFDLNMFF
jgi:hypothetical protein